MFCALLVALILFGFSIIPKIESASNASNAAHGLLLTRDHFAAIVRYFSSRGWFWDYGGGMAIRVVQPNENGTELVYVTANKYEKSAYDPDDIFIYNYQQTLESKYLSSLTLPKPISASRDPDSVVASAALNMLRYANYERTKNSSFAANDIVALMHTHSKYSDILSGMQKPGDVLRITGEQMINCIEDRSTGNVMSYTDELVIPIIQNDPNEATFVEPMMTMLKKYPKASAVIMHRHGIFVWGQNGARSSPQFCKYGLAHICKALCLLWTRPRTGQNTWGRTKQMLECYEYLLEVIFTRRQLNVFGLLPKEKRKKKRYTRYENNDEE